MQVCRIDKYEAHDFIDRAVGNKIMLLSFDKKKGISGSGKRIRKKRGKEIGRQSFNHNILRNGVYEEVRFMGREPCKYIAYLSK